MPRVASGTLASATITTSSLPVGRENFESVLRENVRRDARGRLALRLGSVLAPRSQRGRPLTGSGRGCGPVAGISICANPNPRRVFRAWVWRADRANPTVLGMLFVE